MLTYKEIRLLVVHNKFKQVLAELSGRGVDDKVLELKGWYNSLQDKARQGLLTGSEEMVEENKIRRGLLGLLTDLEEQVAVNSTSGTEHGGDLGKVIQQLVEFLSFAYEGFQSQCDIRNDLRRKMEVRLSVRGPREHEDFFNAHYSNMNEFELSDHMEMRDYSKRVIYKYNKKSLELILGNEELFGQFPDIRKLERHLLVWLGKFEWLFEQNPSMGLLYVGVKERVPFPSDLEDRLIQYLESNK